MSIVAIGMCVLLVMMDGYDILIMAFGAPFIQTEWRLSTREMGLIFSAGLAGMGLGGVTLAPLADLLGRRQIILLCLFLTTTGMFLAAFCGSLRELVLFRLVTGLGVGGMLPAANTAVAEYADERWRSTAVVIQAAGYPLGSTLGGLLALYLVSAYGWRSLLFFGGIFSAVLIPAVVLWVPESIAYLGNRQRSNALIKVDGVVRRRGASLITALLKTWASEPRAVLRILFGGGLWRTTLSICAATFLVQFSFYFVINWAPALLGRTGIASSIGLSGAVLLNCGGIIGDLVFGFLCLRSSPRRLGAFAMTACFVCIVMFPCLPAGPVFAMSTASLIGCFLFASMACLYAIAPTVFPALARSTGTGLALSVGRVGATIGPTAGALLLGGRMQSSAGYSAIMAAPLLCSALILLAWLREAARTPQSSS